jgi:hypothetical protein
MSSTDRGVVTMSAMGHALAGVWLYPASAASFAAGLMCSESVHLRGFWPEFWMVLSLGLLLTSLISSVDRWLAGDERASKEQGKESRQ